MIKLINKFVPKRLIPDSLNIPLNLNKIKKTYIAVFSLIILTVFVLDFSNNRTAKNLSINKENFFENKDMILLKNYLIKNINSPFTNVKYEVKSQDTLLSESIILNKL